MGWAGLAWRGVGCGGWGEVRGLTTAPGGGGSSVHAIDPKRRAATKHSAARATKKGVTGHRTLGYKLIKLVQSFRADEGACAATMQ